MRVEAPATPSKSAAASDGPVTSARAAETVDSFARLLGLAGSVAGAVDQVSTDAGAASENTAHRMGAVAGGKAFSMSEGAQLGVDGSDNPGVPIASMTPLNGESAKAPPGPPGRQPTVLSSERSAVDAQSTETGGLETERSGAEHVSSRPAARPRTGGRHGRPGTRVGTTRALDAGPAQAWSASPPGVSAASFAAIPLASGLQTQGIGSLRFEPDRENSRPLTNIIGSPPGTALHGEGFASNHASLAGRSVSSQQSPVDGDGSADLSVPIPLESPRAATDPSHPSRAGWMNRSQLSDGGDRTSAVLGDVEGFIGGTQSLAAPEAPTAGNRAHSENGAASREPGGMPRPAMASGSAVGAPPGAETASSPVQTSASIRVEAQAPSGSAAFSVLMDESRPLNSSLQAGAVGLGGRAGEASGRALHGRASISDAHAPEEGAGKTPAQGVPQAGPTQAAAERQQAAMGRGGQHHSEGTLERGRVVEQVLNHLESVRLVSGRQEMVLQLRPEHLGQVRIELQAEAQKISAVLAVENAAARDALQSGRDRLAEALASQGYALGQMQVSVSHGGGHASWQGHPASQEVPPGLAAAASDTRTESPSSVSSGTGTAETGRLDYWA